MWTPRHLPSPLEWSVPFAFTIVSTQACEVETMVKAKGTPNQLRKNSADFYRGEGMYCLTFKDIQMLCSR